jgi:hypothetical protein
MRRAAHVLLNAASRTCASEAASRTHILFVLFLVFVMRRAAPVLLNAVKHMCYYMRQAADGIANYAFPQTQLIDIRTTVLNQTTTHNGVVDEKKAVPRAVQTNCKK